MNKLNEIIITNVTRFAKGLCFVSLVTAITIFVCFVIPFLCDRFPHTFFTIVIIFIVWIIGYFMFDN
jgi:hypothetical protein